MSANFWQSSHYEQWMFTKDELILHRAEDLKIYTEVEYAKMNIFWCNFMQSLVNDASNQGHPKVRMQVIGTAMCFFKRFYIRRSLKDVDPFALVCVCILLASKAEEHGQVSVSKMSQLIPIIMKKHFNAYYELKNPIPYDIEFILVETMDCCLIIYQPYRPLIQFLADLKEIDEFKEFEEFEAQSWKVVNDCFRTDCHFLYAPHIIALGSMMVAATLMNIDSHLKNWLPELTVNDEQVFECVKTITEMYNLWKEFIEKEQVQALIDKLPKINGDPQPGWGRPSSSLSILDRPIQQPQQPSASQQSYYMNFGTHSQPSSNIQLGASLAGPSGMGMPGGSMGRPGGMGPSGMGPGGMGPGPSGMGGGMNPGYPRYSGQGYSGYYNQ